MLVAGKQSPVPKRTTSASAAAANKSRVGLTSTNTTSSNTNHRPVVTIKSPHASPGTRSAQTQQTTSTTTAATKNSSITSVPSTARRPVLQPKETHATRALAASRAAQQQKNSISTTSAGNATARSGSATARSGSATARSGSNSATARSGSATNRSTSVQSNSNTKHVDPSAPFHRPNLASLHHSSRTAAKTSTSSSSSRVPVQRMSSVGSNANSSTSAAGNKRSSSTSSVNSNIGTGGRGGLGRSPSPVTIKSKRCKHCSTLVANLEKHMSECPCAPVECNFVDSEDRGKKNTCDFIARGQKHLLEHQQHECPFRMIDCRNAELGCTDQVSAHSMDRHVAENCLFAVMLCEYCKNPVTRGHHEAHISTECPAVKVLCPLGCGRDILRSELTAHIRDQWNDAAHPRTTRREAESGQPSGATRLMPPESARRVAETLISCLEAVNLQKESETILSPSDEVDSMPLGGDVNSFEHALFTGQSVLRSILRLQKYCESNNNNGEFAQQTFELVERRTEVAKTRLEKFTSADNNKIASNLKSQLATSLGKVGVLVSSVGGGNEDQ